MYEGRRNNENFRDFKYLKYQRNERNGSASKINGLYKGMGEKVSGNGLVI